MINPPNTFVYKKIGATTIYADVYAPSKSLPQKVPVILYVHGGYYIRGDRKLIPSVIIQEAFQRNWVLVSIDYRLAPETKQPDILCDIQDAYTWIREQLQDVCSFSIDVSKIIIVGASAGGNAALLSGHYCLPKPTALVGIYPYNDCRKITREKPYSPEDFDEILKIMQEIEATKNDPLPTGEPVRVEIKDGMVSPFNINSESLRNKRNDKLGERGILSPLIVGFDPRSPINAGKLAKLTPSDMVNENYPPVYLMHGDSDQLVPYEHSKDIESACQRMGIEVKLDIVPGVGHCFDLAVEHGDEIFNHHILPIFDFMAEKFQ